MVLKVAFITALLGLVVFSAALVYNVGSLTLELQFADDQISLFLSAEDSAAKGVAKTALMALSDVVHYYPSGTKQKSGSIADRIVERVRARTVRHIIARLKELTGRDLGDDPYAWLK